MESHLRDAFDAMMERVVSTHDRVDGAFPYFADPATGTWTTTDDGNWCGGHWVGLLHLAAEHTGADRLGQTATDLTEVVVASVERESMFFGMNALYVGYRLADLTGETDSTAIGRDGADAMVRYFHELARQVPLGVQPIEAPANNFRGPADDGGPSGHRLGAVDAIYTAVPVLWRAYRETGDPRDRDVAISHADRHLDWYIRPDGRTWHHAEFDPATGSLRRQYNELAFDDDTCWARGQGWCIAGLARAYRETGAGRYRHALERTTDYYRTHTPDDEVPHWDFDHPDAPDVGRDTSAAALAAYGLTRLDPADDTVAALRTYGDRVLESLVANYLTPVGADDGRPPGMVTDGCFNGPAGYADNHELIWTDYYVAVGLAHRLGLVAW